MLLTGKKISLRTVLPADADILLKWENDETIWKMSGTKKTFTKKEIKEYILNQKDIYLDRQLRLIILLKENPIGCVDFFDFDAGSLKTGIGILIEKKYRKKGYAYDALSLLIKYGFEILNLNLISCSISEDNKASLKLFRKHKFKFTDKKNGMYFLQLARK